MAKSRYMPIVAFIVIILLFILVGGGVAWLVNRSLSVEIVAGGDDLNHFKSCDELSTWFNKAKERNKVQPQYLEGDLMMPSTTTPNAAKGDVNVNQNYSTTNLQVAGVDEADIIKTDGDFVYLVNNNDVQIIKVVNGKFVKQAKINLANTPQDLFLQGDKLVVFANGSRDFGNQLYKPTTGMMAPDYYPYPGSQSVVDVYIYNVADRQMPKFERKVSIEGSYLTSRRIGNTTYVVSNFYSNLYDADINGSNAVNFLPQLADTNVEGKTEYKPIADCKDLSYIGQYGSQFLSIVAIPLDSQSLGKQVVLANAQNVYASAENMYVVNNTFAQNNFVCDPIDRMFVPDMCMAPAGSNNTKTNIYKFGLNGTDIAYKAKASVDGQIINQFAMDEFNNNFRIAVTVGEVWNERQAARSVLHVFNDKMDEVGTIDGLGKGEKIYSVRFMGNRGYVVTFKKTDPFYVLDLSNPQSPKLLGELKIPGYSDYLHPYDDNHVIGVGKNATDAEQGSFAWYQGLKMALFDVTDPTNPRQMYKVDIGDRGSESEVLTNHKAFLFDKDKELLVIPSSVAVINNHSITEPKYMPQYGTINFRGFLVYKLNLNSGFVERGRIPLTSSYNNYWWGTNGSRSLYIGDKLITWGDGQLQSNDLTTLNRVDYLKLN